MPNEQPIRDPNKCWHCGTPLHPGHFCEGMATKAAQTPVTTNEQAERVGAEDMTPIPLAEQIAVWRTFVTLHERIAEVFPEGIAAAHIPSLRAALATLEASERIESAVKEAIAIIEGPYDPNEQRETKARDRLRTALREV